MMQRMTILEWKWKCITMDFVTRLPLDLGQKNDVARRVHDVSFGISEQVLLNVSPTNGVMRFRKKVKFSTSHVSKYPLALVRKFGDVAYRLALPLNLSVFHPMFHVLMLKRYCHDDSYVIQWDSVALNQEMSFEEEPISISDRTKKVRSNYIDSLKVQWRH
ncbi:hypothetical protein MTR67_031178 [Solanum verrucosum]|uniref:Tf2-1-like SH3-like domain-containing protein n=1 Tax=Solanum verrucosum TaxID=315347 RepID=A0AAF0U1Z6_SOLVR|nr:hypothetical protein MTR67_031178 [Solanum verrucosum]